MAILKEKVDGINNPIILSDQTLPYYDKGKLPTEIEQFKHQLPWPFSKNETNIFLAAFYLSPDYVMKDRIHKGVDFQVSAGTPVTCIEDGQVVYCIDDERGSFFGNLIIQGSITHIVYRYCHLRLDSFPWDWKSLWDDHGFRPMVKTGQVIGEVSPWFNELDPQINIPEEVEAIHGRKRDHLHLRTEFNPYLFPSLDYLHTSSVEFNPLLILQRPEVYFRKIGSNTSS